MASAFGERLQVAGRVDSQLGVVPGAGLEALGGVEREQLAVVDDGDPIAELVGLFHVVRREHDGLALRVELAHDVPQREAALRVEARGRLVEEEHIGIVEDRPGDHQPLGHAARQLGHVGASPVGEAELLEHLVGLAMCFAAFMPK